MNKLFCLLLAVCMIACKPAIKTQAVGDDVSSCEELVWNPIGSWQVCMVDSVDWLSVAINGVCLTEDAVQPALCGRMTFREDSTLGATVGCNGLGGAYRYAEGVLTVGECCQTEMYCEELDVYERNLFSFLYGTIQVTVYTADSVVLTRANRHIILRRTVAE